MRGFTESFVTIFDQKFRQMRFGDCS